MKRSLLLVLFLAACAEPAGTREPESSGGVVMVPRPYLSPSTVDLTTAVSETPTFEFLLTRVDEETVADSLVDRIGGKVKVVRSSDGTQAASLTVDTSGLHVQRQASDYGLPPRPFSLSSSSSLAPGWYELQFGDALADLEFPKSSIPELASGPAIRFHVGPMPVLRSTGICPDSSALRFIRLEFSEPVGLPASATVDDVVSVRDGLGNPVACVEASSPGVVQPLVSAGDFKTRWVLDCGTVPDTLQIDVTGAVDSGGQQATLPAGGAISITISGVSSLPIENGCHVQAQ